MQIGKYPVTTGGAYIIARVNEEDVNLHKLKTSIEQIYLAGAHAVSLPVGLAQNDYQDLLALCSTIGIDSLASPENSKIIEFLVKRGISAFEISQYNISNDKLLESIREEDKPVIITTEGRLRAEIDGVMELLGWKENTALLHSIPLYPTPISKCNLSAIPKLKRYYNRQIGWDDHTGLVVAPLTAYTMGATIIRVHFSCTSKTEYAFTFDKLKSLVNSIILVKSMIGNKTPLMDRKG